MAVSNRIVVILVFMIIVNICFSWFGLMGFINPGTMPSGSTPNDPLSHQPYRIGFYNSRDILLTFIIGVALAVGSLLVSTFLKINAFAIILFTEVIWIPFLSTVQIFNSIFTTSGVPLVFSVTLLGIFGFVMIILYLYTLIEWSRVQA